MKRNIGRSDRVLRGVLGIWLVVVGVTALRSRRRTVAAIAGIAGAGLLQNAVSGFCGGHWLFGLDTTTDADDGACRR